MHQRITVQSIAFSTELCPEKNWVKSFAKETFANAYIMLGTRSQLRSRTLRVIAMHKKLEIMMRKRTLSRGIFIVIGQRIERTLSI